MKNLAELSVRQLIAVATENAITLPEKAKKVEIIDILTEALKVEEEAPETKKFDWETAQSVNVRVLKKLTTEELLSYPPFADNLEEFKALKDGDLVSLIVKHIEDVKKASNPLILEKSANFELISNLVTELTANNTRKLTKENISSIRSKMQGLTFSKEGREQINTLLDSNRMKMHDKFELEEFKDYVNAELEKGIVFHDGGEVSQFEFLVRTAVRDFGEEIAYAIAKFEKGEIEKIEAVKIDRYMEISYDILLNSTKKDEIVEQLIKLYDEANFPTDYQMLNLPKDLEVGSEIVVTDSIGKPQKVRVIQAQPCIVQMFGKYFMGDVSILDRRYWKFDRKSLSRQEVFNEYCDLDYMEKVYKADKDPAVTPEMMTEQI